MFMHRTDFNFELPEGLIADYPLPERSGSRLLCLNRETGALAHQTFTDCLDYLNPGDVLVLNNTKVIPARLYGHKASGGKIELLIEKIIDNHHAWAHCKASKRPKIGSQLILNNNKKNINITILQDQHDLLKLECQENIWDILSEHGHIPLPKYIVRPDEKMDWERYQTVYAKEKGSVAAPTAGLHFDEALLKKIKAKGIQLATVTLHVGAGTFQPVRVDTLSDHVMHSEYCEISDETVRLIQKSKNNNHKIIAVGTTSVRVLETASLSGRIQPFSGETNLFITPGFKFNTVDAMITNFHLPESTLLMLVCAFGGYENSMRAYGEAIKEKYRFYSYGDAMFIY